jgi:hypothetical protein
MSTGLPHNMKVSSLQRASTLSPSKRPGPKMDLLTDGTQSDQIGEEGGEAEKTPANRFKDILVLLRGH